MTTTTTPDPGRRPGRRRGPSSGPSSGLERGLESGPGLEPGPKPGDTGERVARAASEARAAFAAHTAARATRATGAARATRGTTDGVPDAGAGVAAATVSCAGVPLAALRPAEAAAAVVRLAAGGTAADVHLCDAYALALADRDRRLRGLLRSAALNLPDGPGVGWANRLVHHDRRLPRERVHGPELLLDVFRVGESVGLRHYLIGVTPASVDRLSSALLDRYPRARVVGAEAPPRREPTAEERRAQLTRIRDSGAQLVWLGLDAPRQNREAAQLAAAHPAVYVAVGRAAVDQVSGAARRRGVGWRRALWNNPRFVWAVSKGAVRV
ncbi:WecB/TagA/CpsF family glycosyltransferase [Streptomyces apocyni]|uniref:WecB/TagA/CpsF family glycosyltransferase n=1 Tax=Streptomyces apocyni TaxID=2654677 RepID=UPI0012EB003D|nr:WecB/TagA/CpsF family glycosyltransferase [Streptomyces apocyni]